MSRSASCTRNSNIQRNIENGHYVHNSRFRNYGELPEDRPSWDYRFKRHGEEQAKLQQAERKIRKHG